MKRRKWDAHTVAQWCFFDPPVQGNMSRVDRASERQANHRGPLPALAHTPQDRCVADGRPGGGGLRATREAGLIDEHDGCASAARLFFMRGQSCLSQA